MLWCKLGFHNYVGYHAGLYKSFFKCKHCGNNYLLKEHKKIAKPWRNADISTFLWYNISTG